MMMSTKRWSMILCLLVPLAVLALLGWGMSRGARAEVVPPAAQETALTLQAPIRPAAEPAATEAQLGAPLRAAGYTSFYQPDAYADLWFPLVTNDRNLSELELLQAYKRQPLIEKRFEQMKTDFAIAPVWLKDVERIDALMGVYYLALLAEALLERELRQAMEREGLESLPMYPEGRACRCPTARRLIDIFDPIQRHEIHQPGKTPTIMVTELTPLQRRLLRLLRIPASSYGL